MSVRLVRSRRSGVSSFAIALLAVSTLSACSSDKPGSFAGRELGNWERTSATAAPADQPDTPDPSPAGDATFAARGSVNQVSITDAEPGAELRLVDADGATTATGTTDDAGSFVFRTVPAATGYTVVDAASDAASAPVDVVDVAGSTPPQSFYTSQKLEGGFQYITTRDGNGAPESTGSTTFAAWPPAGRKAQRWFLQPDGGLGATKPSVASSASRWTTDLSLADKVTLPGKKEGQAFDVAPEFEWDQDAAGDAAVFVSSPLAADTVLLGGGSADLWIRSSGSDADLGLTLSEVRPDGKETYLQSGYLRASPARRARRPPISTPTTPVPRQIRRRSCPASGPRPAPRSFRSATCSGRGHGSASASTHRAATSRVGRGSSTRAPRRPSTSVTTRHTRRASCSPSCPA